MNILFNIRQKGRVAILMIVVFFLVALSSYTYNQNINQMGNLFSEMYSDRMIAQDYIYKLVKILHERQIKLANQNISDAEVNKIFKNDRSAILTLLTEYEKTKLTKNEDIQFQEFKKNVSKMIFFEQEYIKSENKYFKNSLLKLHDKSLHISLVQLDKLAEIQISTGKKLNEVSKKIVSFSALLNQFDWALIIIIGLIIQVIIFTARSSVPKDSQNQFLN